MKVRELYKFRLRALWNGRITIFGVILSWNNGVVDIMDTDLKRMTIPEDRILKIERIGRTKNPEHQTHSSDSTQLELFESVI